MIYRAGSGTIWRIGQGGIATHAAAGDWWVVPGQTVIAAYQPIGAASLAASYVNLANPGTYDCTAPVAAPTFDAATGWTFNGTTQYLTTGIVPASVTWSMLARYSNATTMVSGVTYVVAGSYHISGSVYRFVLYAGTGAIPNKTAAGIDGYAAMATLESSGVLAAAGNTGYFDGSSIGTFVPNTTVSNKIIYLGANNSNGAVGAYLPGKIQAAVIYSTTLAAADVATLSAAMAALT